jgi:valine--pyruvate aminotransferase
MKISRFGRRFGRDTGTSQLMEDLGEALTQGGRYLMLGGGNPAHIPEVQSFLQDCLQRICEQPARLAHMVGDYDPPRGDPGFLDSIAGLLNREYGWRLTRDNLCLTGGSQSAFFLLLNMFAGEFEDGRRRRIMLPMVPEYIGYADVGLSEGLLTARRPLIETFPDRTFKYHIDFDAVAVDESIGAVCVSRPTNPTGNVLDDTEVERLLELTRAARVPLIVDNAYGDPFPGIVFRGIRMPWAENVVLCLSLSKLGLPAARTGIVIAAPEIARALARMNAILSLAVGSFGPVVVRELVESGDILSLSRNVIRPYYRRRCAAALEQIRRCMDGLEYFVHRPEGAFFLWLWFPGLPIPAAELYERLKRRGVLVLPGQHFFPGLDADWSHAHECIRLSYGMAEDIVNRGIEMIADEVRRAGAMAPGPAKSAGSIP